MTKIITVNVNGIRSAQKKGIWEFLKSENPDVICMQELKAQENDLLEENKNPLKYHRFWHSAEKKGYSGVAIYSKKLPENVQIGIGNPEFDAEGRFLRADFENYSVISLYLPSGTSSAIRQEFKYLFLDYFYGVLQKLIEEHKNIIICGDWNIAHQNIDLKNWKGNQKNSGFLPEERAWLSKVLEVNWVDAWRTLYPEEPGYTWWSNRGQAYAKDVGWRIDYQITSATLAKQLKKARVYKDIKFSDHAPLIVEYNMD